MKKLLVIASLTFLFGQSEISFGQDISVTVEGRSYRCSGNSGGGGARGTAFFYKSSDCSGETSFAFGRNADCSRESISGYARSYKYQGVCVRESANSRFHACQIAANL